MAKRILLSLSCTLFCVVVGLLGKDVTVVSFQTTDLATRQIQIGKMYFGENQLKIVTAASPETSASEMIYRGDRELVWIIDHERKNFIQLDRKTMQQMADRFAQIYEQMEARLAQLPPDQRAEAERMLQAQRPQTQQPHGELKKAGLTRQINGYHCVKYEFYLDDKLDSELWVTQGSQLNFLAMAKLLRSMGEFYGALTRNLPGGSQSVDFDFSAMSELDGFPILIRNLSDGTVLSETQLSQIHREEVKGDFFAPPSGYRTSNPGQ